MKPTFKERSSSSPVQTDHALGLPGLQAKAGFTVFVAQGQHGVITVEKQVVIHLQSDVVEPQPVGRGHHRIVSPIGVRTIEGEANAMVTGTGLVEHQGRFHRWPDAPRR